MKIRFKTFKPYKVFQGTHNDCYTATEALNKWLEETPNVEIVSWQTTPVGSTNEIYITIQYRELEE